MEFVIQHYGTLSGKIVPVIFDYTNNKIAQPNTSLAHPGKEVVWECSDWMAFHKGVMRFFLEGRFQSRIKYSQSDAIKLTNQVFMQHWERNATFWSRLRSCGYAGEFFNYFKSVGLTDVLTILQAIIVPTVNTTAKFVDTTTRTVEKTTDAVGKSIVNASDTIANTTGLARYVVPIAIGGTVLLVGAYLYKNYIKGNDRVKVAGKKI